MLLNLSILEWARTNTDSSLLPANIPIRNESVVASTAPLVTDLITELCMGVPFMLQLTAAGDTSDPQSIDELYSLRGLLMLWPLVMPRSVYKIKMSGLVILMTDAPGYSICSYS